ncbi:MAG: VOC family protein [Capsulimonadales bacterium]|nr:VOC family protein [Capsulimonadales bacterium]
MAMRFSHIALSCADPIATEKWYAKHFGFVRARVIPLGEEQIVFVRSGDVYLELFQAKGDAPAPPAGNDGPAYPAIRHLAFQVDHVDATLAAMGEEAKVTFGPFDFDAFIPGWRTVWVADPDGNIVEISQGYTDQENPPALEG